MEIKTDAKIHVKLESFDNDLLLLSCQKIMNIINNSALKNISIVTLPTRKRIYCVLRSPHVDKDSREHFEIRIYKRVIEISYDYDVPIFDLLSKSDLPSGVFYRLCLYQ